MNSGRFSASSSSNSTYGFINEKFGYDNFGNLTSHINSSTGIASQSFTADYNALSWKKFETTPLGKVGYLYDDYGRRERLTWPDNFYITYDYGTSLLLKNIKQQGATPLATYTYDERSQKESLVRANSVSSNYVFDDFQRLTTIATDVGGSAQADDYNASFIYNPANQVIEKEVVLGNPNYEYTKHTASETYTPNGLNQITSWSGTSVSYDTNGNLKKIGTKSYVYNNDNLLITANGTSLRYDAEKRLYKVGSTCFLYDEQDLIAETNCSGTVLNRYVHGDAVDDPTVWYQGSGTGTKRFYTEDYNGSVVGITNNSGTSYAINSYDEYGIPETTNIGRFQFTGQVWLDEIELYYYKARIYNPKLGRFMQTDPIGYEDGMNWYAYAYQDPINNSDPQGKYACDNEQRCDDNKERQPEKTTEEFEGHEYSQVGSEKILPIPDKIKDVIASKGGKRNISVGEHNRNSDPKKVEEAMEKAKKDGKSEHYKALKGLLKVIKRGGRGIFPVLPITDEMIKDIYAPEVPETGCRSNGECKVPIANSKSY